MAKLGSIGLRCYQLLIKSAGIFLLAVLLGLVGCKEENTPPKVRVLRPTSNEFFSSHDTLSFQISVEDAEGLESLTVQILNSDFQIVFPGVSISLSGKKESVESGQLDLTSFISKGETYFLNARVDDGEEIRQAFQPILVEITPREREGFFALRQSGSQAELFHSTSGQNWQTLESVSNSTSPIFHGGQGFDGLGFASSSFNDFKVYAVDGQVVSTIPKFQSFPEPSFLSASAGNGILHVSRGDGIVTSLNANGQAQDQFNLSTDYQAIFLHRAHPYLIAQEENVLTGDRRLVFRFYPGGAVIQQRSFSGKIRAILEQNSEYYILHEEGGDVKLSVYNLGTNNLYENGFVSNATFLSACKSQKLFLSTSQGIFTHTFGSTGLVQKDAEPAYAMYADQATGQFFQSKLGKIELRSGSSYSLEEEIPVQMDTIRGLVVLFTY